MKEKVTMKTSAAAVNAPVKSASVAPKASEAPKAEPVKTPAPAAAAKPAASKTTKAAASKPSASKAAAKSETKPDLMLQFQGKEADVNDVVEKVKEAYAAEGHRLGSIKSFKIYLKPEEYAAYYVINDKFAGKVNLF